MTDLKPLFRELFSTEEFRHLLETAPGSDESLLAQLPGSTASLDQIIDAGTSALQRRGLLNSDFFTHLLQSRPHRSEYIAKFAPKEGSPLSHARIATDIQVLSNLSKHIAPPHPLRHEISMALARLMQEYQNPPPPLKTAPSAYIQDLITKARSADITSAGDSGTADKTPNKHPDALILHRTIEEHIRMADAEQAVMRLLDMARRFSPGREIFRTIIMLSARISAHKHGRKKIGRSISADQLLAILDEILTLSEICLDASSIHTFTAVSTSPGVNSSFCRVSNDTSSSAVPILTCTDITKTTYRTAHFRLSRVSLRLHGGTITALIGPNGSGKTTLLRILAGETVCTTGVLSYPRLNDSKANGKPIDWPLVKSQIGYLAQQPEAWNGQLLDNLHESASVHGVRGRDNIDLVGFYLERLGLSRFKDLTWQELSAGYKIRFELARILVGKPLLVILDEPLAPLDIVAQHQFLRDLRDLIHSDERQPAALISSQHIREVEEISDHTLCLSETGEVVYDGPSRLIGNKGLGLLFELPRNISENTRNALIKRFGPSCLTSNDIISLLQVPNSDSASDVWEIITHDGAPDHVRNTSSSAARFLWEKEKL